MRDSKIVKYWQYLWHNGYVKPTYEEVEEEVEILKKDYCTTSEAISHLKDGTIIFEAEELKTHADSYVHELGFDEEEGDEEDFREMLSGGKLMAGWEKVNYNGKTYYIEYFF